MQDGIEDSNERMIHAPGTSLRMMSTIAVVRPKWSRPPLTPPLGREKLERAKEVRHSSKWCATSLSWSGVTSPQTARPTHILFRHLHVSKEHVYALEAEVAVAFGGVLSEYEVSVCKVL